MWLSLVERCVRDAEAAGSSPVTSTLRKSLRIAERFFYCLKTAQIRKFQQKSGTGERASVPLVLYEIEKEISG